MATGLLSLSLLLALLSFCQSSRAGSPDQSGMNVIFKDSEHVVYMSRAWVCAAGCCFDCSGSCRSAGVLRDYDRFGHHPNFGGSQSHLSSETEYRIDCEKEAMAFKAGATYQGHKATGKQQDVQHRTSGPWHDSIEWYKPSDQEDMAIFQYACTIKPL